jgi:16S rRNA processing protein RimM
VSDGEAAAELEVGRVTKPHGLRGEVIVKLLTDVTERLDPGSVLSTTRGPLRVVASRRHQTGWIVSFEGVGDRDAAERLREVVLRAEPMEMDDALWVHELVGCRVVTTDGVDHGEVVSVQDNPASDLLVLDDDTLVPLAFLVSHEPGRVVVDVPDGLFDL